MNSTKADILDAAERRFARDGIHRVSLRSILKDAGINPALAHYHFGSRENLIRELLLRRLVPLSEERMRRFDELAGRPGDPGYTLRDVLRAFTAPAFRMLDEHPHFARFLGQVQGTMDEELRAFYEQYLTPSLRRLSELGKRVLPPGLEETRRVTRAFFFLGIIGYTLSRIEVLDAMAAAYGPAPRGDALAEELVAFCEAGLLAGLPPGEQGASDE